MAKTRVAVFFGGRSPEHDVSVVTGLQVLDALRPDLYDAFPVYIAPGGEWFTGDALREKANYIPDPELRRKLARVSLDLSAGETGVLTTPRKGLLSGPGTIAFDIAIPAFHGAFGEDGCFQGLMELANVPYTGMRLFASAIAMDKVATKTLVKARTSAPQLPCVAITKKPGMVTRAPALPEGWSFPVIVKPAHMGSSIGVARAGSQEEIDAILQSIFVYDSKALIEPYVASRAEYNISVRRTGGAIATSAIELPKTTAELLDFKEKYVRGNGPKKTGGAASEGMLSLTRELNPKLDPAREADIRRWAAEIFDALDGTGTPRLDFMVDTATNDIFFNEINPCPGSFAYFLWEAAANKALFSELLTDMLNEAIACRDLTLMPVDPVPGDARLFKRA